MATSTNTIKTRIQLKSDTEANWNKAGPKDGSLGFVPLLGELIVYTADATHPFSRLKVGDGVTNVVSLPFIDSGTLNGEETEIVKINNRNLFPSPGSEDKLYVDLSTNKIYHYTAANGYIQLSNFDFSLTKSTIKYPTRWYAGTKTYAELDNNMLKIVNGSLPVLDLVEKDVVTGINKGVDINGQLHWESIN